MSQNRSPRRRLRQSCRDKFARPQRNPTHPLRLPENLIKTTQWAYSLFALSGISASYPHPKNASAFALTASRVARTRASCLQRQKPLLRSRRQHTAKELPIYRVDIERSPLLWCDPYCHVIHGRERRAKIWVRESVRGQILLTDFFIYILRYLTSDDLRSPSGRDPFFKRRLSNIDNQRDVGTRNNVLHLAAG